jgi:hypothetical protein
MFPKRHEEVARTAILALKYSALEKEYRIWGSLRRDMRLDMGRLREENNRLILDYE